MVFKQKREVSMNLPRQVEAVMWLGINTTGIGVDADGDNNISPSPSFLPEPPPDKRATRETGAEKDSPPRDERELPEVGVGTMVRSSSSMASRSSISSDWRRAGGMMARVRRGGNKRW